MKHHSQIAFGVLVSWAAQSVQILSGFVVPRLVNDQLGAQTLGVWDLGWSLISFFTLLTGGIGSTVNRHVSLYRSENAWGKLNETVSSVAALQRCAALVIFLLVVTLAWLFPFPLAHSTPDLRSDAQWTFLFLGISLSASVASAVYGGIVTGFHRWPLYHGIYTLTNVVSFVGMCAVLKMGYGVIGLAVVHCLTEQIGRFLRVRFARRLCPELQISMKLANWRTILELWSFGGKMLLSRASHIFMNQTVCLLIATHLGPAALAIFVRPRSLLRQVAVFPQKYGNMLVPSAAVLSSSTDRRSQANYLTVAVRNGLYLCLPMLLFLSIYGEQLLEMWMGRKFADGKLLLILAAGLLFEIAYHPLNTVLFGLNLHGRPSVATMFAALLATASVCLGLYLDKFDLHLVAVAMSLPWIAVHGFYHPWYTCNRLGIPFFEFLRGCWGSPLTSLLPFFGTVAACKLLLSTRPVIGILVAFLTGLLVLFITYWIWVFPQRWKSRILKWVSMEGTSSPSEPHRPKRSVQQEQTLGINGQ